MSRSLEEGFLVRPSITAARRAKVRKKKVKETKKRISQDFQEEIRFLGFVDEHEGISFKLAHTKLGMARNKAREILGALEEDGFITRDQGGLSTTPKGKALLKESSGGESTLTQKASV